MTQRRAAPDACIDCVGMESHGFTVDNVLDQVKAKFYLGTERPHALRQAILAAADGYDLIVAADEPRAGFMSRRRAWVYRGQGFCI